MLKKLGRKKKRPVKENKSLKKQTANVKKKLDSVKKKLASERKLDGESSSLLRRRRQHKLLKRHKNESKSLKLNLIM